MGPLNPRAMVLPTEYDLDLVTGAVTHAKNTGVKREPVMPELLAHHKLQRNILVNNLFVQISAKYPHLKRADRKRMAKTIGYRRVAEFLQERTTKERIEKSELDTLREQDYAEARPPEGE